MAADVIRLPVKNGQTCLLSTVDDGLLGHRWYLDDNGYMTRNTPKSGKRRRGKMTMHRQILDAPFGMLVDHINGNRLDNRRENLRLCNITESAWNCSGNAKSTSRYKGVCWNKHSGKWQAAIRVKPRLIYLGLFESEKEAAHIYDNAARKHHRKFARLNFPQEPPQ